MEHTSSSDLQHTLASAAIPMTQMQTNVSLTLRSAPEIPANKLLTPTKVITPEVQCDMPAEIIKDAAEFSLKELKQLKNISQNLLPI